MSSRRIVALLMLAIIAAGGGLAARATYSIKSETRRSNSETRWQPCESLMITGAKLIGR